MTDKLIFKNTNLLLFIISSIIIYFLIYIPALNIPFHSDDYSYFLQGTSWEARLKHYMDWSGRLITDFTSSYLLNLFTKPVYTAINSFVLLLIIVIISVLPYIVTKKDIFSHKSFLSLWLIFFAYWISNPNLGQTTFWIVGAANYIWPLMWASIYFLFILYLLVYEKKLNFLNSLGLISLGILAGFSNEATGISVVFFTFILLFIYKKSRKIIFFALTTTTIGFLFLYLAPGNYVRLSNPAFETWNNTPILAKIIDHFLSRLPSSIKEYWYIITLMFVSLYTLCALNFKKDSNKNIYIFIYLFICLTIFSLLVLVKAPYMPPRILNTGLFFLLCSFSFILIGFHIFLEKYKTLFLYFAFIISATIFIVSYSLFSYAIKQTKYQEEIRSEIIEQAKRNNLNEAKIPDWFFTRLLKDTDKFDLYKSNSMPKYYEIEQITWLPAYFNYAILKTVNPYNINLQIKDDLEISSIYYYKEYFISKKIVLVFNKPIQEKFDISLNTNDKKVFNLEIDKLNSTLVGNKYYYLLPLINIDIIDIDKISFRFTESSNMNIKIVELDLKRFLK